MTPERYEAMMNKFNELFSQVIEAVESLKPDRLYDIDTQLDNLYDRI